ncbi:putative membrane protein [Streptomyces davaonensis JCM 4913]|uniref:Putative membrane protein n=1 Tax=Streptomyces davaonensis (strain DSM 101723 / JCM 4913 / KCC S-0913 / 768) TaxID=1214101 RepID=K4RFJ9_STRDJ|nr:ABC transporter permease [Streptomyces davaonensis]CCK32380.1 putative membrane protein [Streptomyces davaonensis JCM 4913]
MTASPTNPGPRATAGYLLRAWRLELRQLVRTRLYVFLAVFLPLICASLAFYMLDGSERDIAPVSVALSAGLMGMWSSTLLGSGNAINRLRWMQVLEPLVASPRSTFFITLPFALATATLGVYGLAATLAWSALLFDMPLHLADPALFLLALPATVLALGMLGLLLSSAFILYPTAQSLANFFEYPVWMLSGMLAPISTLPEPVRVISWCLSPTWGVKALEGAALGTSGAARAAGMCVLLSAVYGALTLLLQRRFEWMARSSGTLALQ